MKLESSEIETVTECLLTMLTQHEHLKPQIRRFVFDLTSSGLPSGSQVKSHLLVESLIQSLEMVTTDHAIRNESESQSFTAISQHNFTLIFLLKSIKTILTTSDVAVVGKAFVLDTSSNEHFQYLMRSLCSSLVRILVKSGYLVHVSNGLDCFYEIWSEDFYDQQLAEHNVIGILQQGSKVISTMFA